MSTQDDNLPDTISTPEGDNEFAPDQPLVPIEGAVLIPPGSAPSDPGAPGRPETNEKPTGIEEFIDEVARGEYM